MFASAAKSSLAVGIASHKAFGNAGRRFFSPDPQSETKLMALIYDRFHDVVCGSAAGKPSQFPEDKHIIQICTNGLPINPDDFKNAYGPMNSGKSASMGATRMFSAFTDALPTEAGPTYTASQQSVGQVYQFVVNGAISKEPPPSPEDLAAYEKAQKLLVRKIKKNVQGNEVDDDGNFKTVEVDITENTPVYANYLDKQADYANALSLYRAAQIESEKDERLWLVKEPALRAKMDRAYNNWRAQGAVPVENALQMSQTKCNMAVSKLLADTQKALQEANLKLAMVGDSFFRLNFPFPSNWYSEEIVPNLTAVTMSTSQASGSSDSRFTKMNGGASFSSGLFRIGGSGSHESGSEHSHSDATHVSISCKLGVVRIERPWFNNLLFDVGGWAVSTLKPGEISSGDLKNTTNCKMPLIPVAMIVARDVKITADWSSDDKEKITSATQGGGSFGWGPFSLGGSYSSSSKDESFTSKFDGSTITVPGLQVVAFVSQVLPRSPRL